MRLFEINIRNIYGLKGKAWLDSLPSLVQKLSLKLKLYDLKPLPNLTYHYVLKGYKENLPIILKLGLDVEALQKEALVIDFFKGFGVANLIAEEKGALLLERAVPGHSLQRLLPRNGCRSNKYSLSSDAYTSSSTNSKSK